MSEKEYEALAEDLDAMVAGVPHRIANYANVAALLWERLTGINWVGFYFVEGDKLVLGPFQGKVACVEIGYGKGVCGTAWQRGKTIRVEDVHAFPGHIACDGASRSEIVLPLFREGKVYGVLDIDSPSLARFSPADEAGLSAAARTIEKIG